LPGQSPIRSPIFATSEEASPFHGSWTLRQRNQLGDRSAAYGDSEPLTGFDPAENATDVISELASRYVGHEGTVAVLLRTR
jgi:hypothetical protein